MIGAQHVAAVINEPGVGANTNIFWIVAAASGTSGTAGTSGEAGAAGLVGPGVVYRGIPSGTAYFHTNIRRDIVLFNNIYYLTNNPAKSGLTGWNTPPNSDWEQFGAQLVR
jgi:hypothetical protein